MVEPEAEERAVGVFFYGSFINLDVLAEQGLQSDVVEVVSLAGFDIRIGPIANLVPSDEHTVYGILTYATHSELARLYEHAEQVLGGRYLPEAVVVRDSNGRHMPALCYIAPALQPGPAASDYVDRIVTAAKGYGFPASYVERLESYR